MCKLRIRLGTSNNSYGRNSTGLLARRFCWRRTYWHQWYPFNFEDDKLISFLQNRSRSQMLRQVDVKLSIYWQRITKADRGIIPFVFYFGGTDDLRVVSKLLTWLTWLLVSINQSNNPFIGRLCDSTPLSHRSSVQRQCRRRKQVCEKESATAISRQYVCWRSVRVCQRFSIWIDSCSTTKCRIYQAGLLFKVQLIYLIL